MEQHNQVTPADLRKFGLTMAVVIAILFGLIFSTIFGWNYLNYSWLFVLYFTLSALLIPKSLIFIYKVWSYIGRILNWINTRIILGFIFILMFIPIALFFKLIARDLLKMKFDENADSYRQSPSPDQQKIDLTKPY